MPATRALAARSARRPASAPAPDAWARRARPTFLYVMYVLLLCAVPLGAIAGFSPAAAQAMTAAMTGYLGALPEPLYALFATCYLGYTAARQWGKLRGVDR